MALRINISKKNDFRENEYIVYLFRRHLSTARIRLGILAWAAICVFIGITSGVLLHWNSTVTINDDLLEAPISAWDTCRDLRVRREWRNLAHSEQQDYFDAVHCLLEQPAKISNGSAFDDFAYVHKTFGSYSHKSALFLPWHRWFIYVYETALIKQCGYSGALPYWDWTLDWEDITVSPVFDPVHGFGGDGNATGEETVGDGRCVIDGPFAGLQALRYDAAYNPHCLSRGFLRGKLLEELCSNDIHPDVITTILQKPSFKDFMHDLEERPHIAIPTGIRGDWVKFTVPYDPLWWLHHSQLDRLWSKWQQSDHGHVLEYNGKANNNTNDSASVWDIMDYGGFLPALHVQQVMGTESETLCYAYD